MEPCGMCEGRGWYYGSMYDRLGYQTHFSPPQITCEYCGRSGYCEEGHKLMAAIVPQESRDALHEQGIAC